MEESLELKPIGWSRLAGVSTQLTLVAVYIYLKFHLALILFIRITNNINWRFA